MGKVDLFLAPETKNKKTIASTIAYANLPVV